MEALLTLTWWLGSQGHPPPTPPPTPAFPHANDVKLQTSNKGQQGQTLPPPPQLFPHADDVKLQRSAGVKVNPLPPTPQLFLMLMTSNFKHEEGGEHTYKKRTIKDFFLPDFRPFLLCVQHVDIPAHFFCPCLSPSPPLLCPSVVKQAKLSHGRKKTFLFHIYQHLDPPHRHASTKAWWRKHASEVEDIE